MRNSTAIDRHWKRSLTYSHLFLVFASVAALGNSTFISNEFVQITCWISMLSIPVFTTISLWLIATAFEAGDVKRLMHALVETALTILQVGFLMPQLQ
jgi:hypothetical protein